MTFRQPKPSLRMRRSSLATILPPRELASLDRMGTTVAISSGTCLARQGNTGRECFLILEGAARLDRRGRLVDTVGRDQFLGELSVLTGRPRSADVTMIEDSVLHAFTPEEFRVLMASAPHLRDLVLQGAVKKAVALAAVEGPDGDGDHAPCTRPHTSSTSTPLVPAIV